MFAMSDATVTLRHEIEPEDQARAEFYALLARLFADAPDASLLAAIAAGCSGFLTKRQSSQDVIRAVRAAHAALYFGSRLFGIALYGWAFYFSGAGDLVAGGPVELPAMINVCVHCGAGSPADNLQRLGRLTALCPACNQRTLYFPPFGGAI